MSKDPPNCFTWTETRLGRWERDVDEVEQFYTSLAKSYEGTGRMFFAITSHISLSTAVSEGRTIQEEGRCVEEALRNAWLRLRHDHPTIGAWVDYDEKRRKCVKVYETFLNEEEQTRWLDDTFRTIASRVKGEVWCNSDPPAPRLPTLFLLTPPMPINDAGQRVQRDIVLRSPHDIIDGIGTLQLLNNLFVHAAEMYASSSSHQIVTFGSEIANLSPPFRVAVNLASAPTQAQKTRFDEEVMHNASLRQGCDVMSIPFKQGAVLPDEHQRVAITLSKVQTAKLLQACRGLGASVTHAFHAAIAMTIRDMQKRSVDARSMRYISYCLINERSRCAPPYNTQRHAAAVYHSVSGKSLVVDLIVPSTSSSEDVKSITQRKEFKNIMRDIKTFYYDVQNDVERLPLTPLHLAHSTPAYTLSSDPMAIPPVPLPNTRPSVSISSFGVIENLIAPKHGPFKLHNPWVTGEELGTGLGIFLGTWSGQISLSAAYNAAWHDENEVLRCLESCIKLVLDALDLQAYAET